ncbi:MAG: diacylglycerol kinase family lipid kinase [Eubacteriales bacterium]|nr:diacylglycerol kinase family lipid kinase [Eubacteriales bacterium]
MKHLFVVNPVAGKGRALGFVETIRIEAAVLTDDYEIVFTEYPGHATEIVKEHVGKEQCRVYSVGGDGTVNEIVNGLIGSSSTLAVIPAGSGNDYLRSIYEDDVYESIVSRTIRGIEKPIDVVKVNDRCCANVSSMGLDAEAAYMANKIKHIPLIPGGLSYILGLVVTLIKCKSYNMKITMDSEVIEGRMLAVVVANGKYYGNKIMPAPRADISDGILDICLIRKKGRLEILKLFPRYIKGKHEGLRGITFHRCNHVHIISTDSVPINLDGEVTRIDEATFDILPGALQIVVPAEK